MMVKICGITNREDAVAAVEAGVTALGFNFYPSSPRYVTPAQASEIGRGLNSLKVGVFVDEPVGRIEEIVKIVGLDVIQLHGNETPDQMPHCIARKPSDGTSADAADTSVRATVRVWKAFRASIAWTSELFEAYAVEAFVLDGPEPGSGREFVWSRAQNLGHRIIVAGGLDDSNVAEAIRTLRPWGVDACSRLEQAPGIKDHEKVARFVRAARGELS